MGRSSLSWFGCAHQREKETGCLRFGQKPFWTVAVRYQVRHWRELIQEPDSEQVRQNMILQWHLGLSLGPGRGIQASGLKTDKKKWADIHCPSLLQTWWCTQWRLQTLMPIPSLLAVGSWGTSLTSVTHKFLHEAGRVSRIYHNLKYVKGVAQSLALFNKLLNKY